MESGQQTIPLFNNLEREGVKGVVILPIFLSRRKLSNDISYLLYHGRCVVLEFLIIVNINNTKRGVYRQLEV